MSVKAEFTNGYVKGLMDLFAMIEAERGNSRSIQVAVLKDAIFSLVAAASGTKLPTPPPKEDKPKGKSKAKETIQEDPANIDEDVEIVENLEWDEPKEEAPKTKPREKKPQPTVKGKVKPGSKKSKAPVQEEEEENE